MNDLKNVLPVGIVVVLVAVVSFMLGANSRQATAPTVPLQNQPATSTQEVVPLAPVEQVTSTAPAVVPPKTPSSTNGVLNKKTWYWVSTVFSGGTRVTPKKAGVFSVTFDTQKKTISMKTDCNGAGADYVLNGNKLTFIGLRSTQMYCEQSQELAFTSVIAETAGYHFLSTGGLALDLKNGSGTMFFR